MTAIKIYWRLFVEQGLQVPDRKSADRLWYTLLDHDIPGKTARLYQISRLADAPPVNGPACWFHFFAAFPPATMIDLTELAVTHRKLSRHQANVIQERVLANTRKDGSWDLAPLYYEEYHYAHAL